VPYLLSLHTSTRGTESFSNRVLAEFTRQFLVQHPDVEVKSRFTGDIPHLDYDAQEGGRIPLEMHDERLVAGYALCKELTDELIGASALVIATPMYNWGPPSSLKAWIDRVINTQTFYKNAGVIADLPVTVIISSGGHYSEGDNARHDHLRPLLTECFSRMGVEDLLFVNCDPSGPIERGRVAPDAPDSGLTRALNQIPDAVTRVR